MSKLTYIASPYSSHIKDDPSAAAAEMAHRAHEVDKFCAWLRTNSTSYHPISPISHWHHISQFCDLPTDAQSWYDYNSLLQKACEGTIILGIPGWEKSQGVDAEIRDAQEFRHEVRIAIPHDSSYIISRF